MAIIAGVFFGFMLFEASINFNWFTPIRSLYLSLGVANGLLMGLVETRIVIRGLSENTKTTLWQTLPISLISFVLPFIAVVLVFGVSEYLPFGGYVVLSAVPIYYGITGWYYSQFEKERKVRVHASIYGFMYWTEPIPDYSNIFNQFLSDLARKDYIMFANPMGYVGQSKKLLAALEAKQDIELSTREFLLDVLQAMDKQRRRGLAIFIIFMVSMPLLAGWLFILTSTNTFGMQQIVAGKIVSGREITLALGLIPFGSVFSSVFLALRIFKKRFQRRMDELLASFDSDKVYSAIQ